MLEAHLLDEDIPLAHRGMQGRVWRAKKGAERNRKKMDAMRERMKAAAGGPQGGQGRGQGGRRSRPAADTSGTGDGDTEGSD